MNQVIKFNLKYEKILENLLRDFSELVDNKVTNIVEEAKIVSQLPFLDQDDREFEREFPQSYRKSALHDLDIAERHVLKLEAYFESVYNGSMESKNKTDIAFKIAKIDDKIKRCRTKIEKIDYDVINGGAR